MRFGARAHSLDDVEFLAEAGFDFAEIDWKDPAAAEADLAELAMLRAKYGIDYLAHGPSESDPFDSAAIEAFLGARIGPLLTLAAELGIVLYTQHLWLDPRFVAPETIAAKIDRLAIWIQQAGRAGVAFCLENLSEHAEHLAPALAQLPALGLTLDLGHGQILAEPNAAWGLIARFPDRIRHVHLHDNHGGSGVAADLHLPIGHGCVDFAGILGLLRKAGCDDGFSFEIPLSQVERGRQAIARLWDEARQ